MEKSNHIAGLCQSTLRTRPNQRGGSTTTAPTGLLSHQSIVVDFRKYGIGGTVSPSLFSGNRSGLGLFLLGDLGVGLGIRLFGGLLLLLDPLLHRYSQEGRPYILSVVCGVLYFAAVYNFFCGRRKVDFFYLVMSALWFLLSIGFQSLIVIADCCLIAAPLLIFKRYRHEVYHFLLANGLAFSAFTPFMTLMVKSSRRYINAPVSFQITTALQEITFQNVILLSSSERELGPICLFLALVALMVSLLLPVGERRVPGILLRFVTVFLLLFPVTFLILFKMLIRRPLFDRYYLFYAPALVLGGVIALSCLLQMVPQRLKEAWPIKIISGAIFAFGIFFQFEGLRTGSYLKYTSDLPSIYRFFKEEALPNTIALPISLQTQAGWTPDSFIASEFYYAKGGRVEIPVFHTQTAEGFLMSALKDRLKPPAIYFVNLPEFNEKTLSPTEVAALQANFTNSRIFKFLGPFNKDNAWVIELPVHQSLARTVRDFLLAVAALHPGSESNFHVQTLIKIAEGFAQLSGPT